ncbi:hypothetical protein FACS189444_1510 [Spirochaetia bacterium]|nr:hypothetical protein FACS189444_1510 [Spirochaetia bacterium]
MNEDIAPDINYLVFRKCTPSWRLKEHFVENCDITYIIKGGARYTINGVVHELSPGSLICLSEGNRKAAITWPDRLMNCFSVNFSLKNNKNGDDQFPFPAVSDIGIQKDIIDMFNELVYAWVDRQPGYIIKTRGLLLLVLHRFLELTVFSDRMSAKDYRVQKTTRYIAKHYAEKIMVKDMARMAGLNTVYFGALFAQETGLTLNQYVNRMRVKNAENLLRSGEYTVADAAEHCGYADVFHFYKQFKAVMGIPPSHCIPKRASP